MDDDLPDGRPGLALLTPHNKAEFDAAVAALAQPISDYSFACAFSWGQAMGLYYARLHNHLCLFANGSDLTMLLPPIPVPGATSEDLRACLIRAFELMDAWNIDHGGLHLSRIEYVSDEMLERINAVIGGTPADGSPALQLSAAPMGGDYIYPVSNMIHLPGGDLKSKRGAKNRFIREYPNHRTELMRPEHIPMCLELLNCWCSHGDDVHEGQVTLDAEQKSTADLRRRDLVACSTAVEQFEALGLKGLLVFVDDKLVAFTLGESLSPSQASIMFEKTHPDYNGAPQFIFSEFCRLCWSDKPEINVGDDWGIPTLRFTKQSYRPTRMLAKYVMTRPVTAPVAPTMPVTPEPAAMPMAAESVGVKTMVA